MFYCAVGTKIVMIMKQNNEAKGEEKTTKGEEKTEGANVAKENPSSMKALWELVLKFKDGETTICDELKKLGLGCLKEWGMQLGRSVVVPCVASFLVYRGVIWVQLFEEDFHKVAATVAALLAGGITQWLLSN